MLRPLPMKHVRLLILTEDLPQASLTLAETESFHPDTRQQAEPGLPNQPGRDYHDTYLQASSHLSKISKLIPVEETPRISQVRVIDHPELQKIDSWLAKIWNETSRYEEALRRLDDQEHFVKEQEASLRNFANLNIDLGMLRSKTRFLDFYVGIVPRENLRQLEGAVGLADHILHTYMQRGDNAHVVIVGPTGNREAHLSSVLSAAGFQHLPIPQELNKEPTELHAALAAQCAAIKLEREQLHERVEQWSETFRERLTNARRYLLLAEPFVTLDPSIRSAGHLAALAGWVPKREVARLEERLRENLVLPFHLEARDPLAEERKIVPSVPVKSRLLQPFAMLVKQYGIPEYGEVDPTALFAVTFLLMFGSMFGDVGQGAVIAVLSWTFKDKIRRFWLFGFLAGLSSIAFGFLYGSIFGYEHVLPALWMSPLHDPLLMLKIALVWGVLFLVTACSLAIYNRAMIKNWSAAIFGHHGLVNLVFYLSLIWGGLNLALTGLFATLPMLLIVASLAALSWYSWRQMDAPVSEKILVVFIETLETVIGYTSNTLSFLRVAAFSLNHVALSIAVLTLAGMMGAFGHVITVILGNLFVLVLEGGIVMIQVMRLEFYEGFARYFSGDGHEFAPLRLQRGKDPVQSPST